jgi:hypothetical protein
MDRMNTPQAQIAMRLLQASQGASGKPAGSLGAIFGDSVMGYQNDAQQQQMQKLQMELMRSQTARMNKPEQEQYTVTQGDSGPVFTPNSQLGGARPYAPPGDAEKLPDGMRIGKSGDPEWIPGFLDGKLRLAREGRSPGVTVNTGAAQLPAPPQGMYRPDATRPGLVREPGAKPAMPAEAQAKQEIGIKNLGVAVEEYTKALPKLAITGYLNPNERANIGTVYNNMMLQAKEAYNLGVLNGPDFKILQEVVTNPLSAKGLITSKTALAKQATELNRIMQRMRPNVTSYADQQNASGAGASNGEREISIDSQGNIIEN